MILRLYEESRDLNILTIENLFKIFAPLYDKFISIQVR